MPARKSPARLRALIGAALDSEGVPSIIFEQVVRLDPLHGDVRTLSRLACVNKALSHVPWPSSIILERSALYHKAFSVKDDKPFKARKASRLETGVELLKDACVALADHLQLTCTPANVTAAAREEDEEAATKVLDDLFKGATKDEEKFALMQSDAFIAASEWKSAIEVEALALAELSASPLNRVAGSAAERAFRSCCLFSAAVGSACDGTGKHRRLPLLRASKECIDTLLELLPALRALALAPQLPAEMHAVVLVALGHAAALLEEVWSRCDGEQAVRAPKYETDVEAEVREVVHCLRVCFLCGGARFHEFPLHEELDEMRRCVEIPASGVAASLRAVLGSAGRSAAYMMADAAAARNSSWLRLKAKFSVLWDIREDGSCCGEWSSSPRELLGEGADVLCDTFVDENVLTGERGRAARALAELARSCEYMQMPEPWCPQFRFDNFLWDDTDMFAASGARELADSTGSEAAFYSRSRLERQERMCRPLDLHIEALHLAKAAKEDCADYDLLGNEDDTDDAYFQDEYNEHD